MLPWGLDLGDAEAALDAGYAAFVSVGGAAVCKFFKFFEVHTSVSTRSSAGVHARGSWDVTRGRVRLPARAMRPG